MTTPPKSPARRRRGPTRRGDASYNEASAAIAFEQFSLDWLRTIARGANAAKASKSLMAFVALAQAGRIPWRAAIEAAASALDQRCRTCAAASELDATMFEMARAALILLVEALADDRFATARRSSRSLDLHAAAQNFIRACEDRARSEGWSYLDLLVRSVRSSSVGP